MTDCDTKRMLLVLAVLAASALVSLRVIDAHLVSAASPRGIVSFEFCAFNDSCSAILDAWHGQGREFAMLSLGLDYLFLVGYASLVALTLVYVARRLDGWKSTTARVCARLALVAGAADAGENAGLILVIVHGGHAQAAMTAAVLATIKFALIGIAIIGALAGAALVLVNARKAGAR